MPSATLQPDMDIGAAWTNQTLRNWVAAASDLTFLLDDDGLVRGAGCRDDAIWREFAAAGWLGQPWARTASAATQAALTALLRNPSLDSDTPWRQVDYATQAGRPVPMLCATARLGAHIVVYSRDIRTMDLTRLVTEHDSGVARAYAGSARASGMPLESLWLESLAPAARRLGDLWQEDFCSFTDVTVGVGRLLDVLRDSVPPAATTGTAVESRRILLAACPGEQHTFGLSMVGAFFRTAGWAVQQENITTEASIVRAAGARWFGVIGISASDEARLAALASTIRRVRRASRNPAIRVLVGGGIFTDQPHLAAQVGADGTAYDGRQAVHQALRLLERFEAVPVV